MNTTKNLAVFSMPPLCELKLIAMKSNGFWKSVLRQQILVCCTGSFLLSRGMWVPVRPAPSLFSIPWQYVQSSQCSHSAGESLSSGSPPSRHLGNWLVKCSFNRVIEGPRMPLQESFSSDSVVFLQWTSSNLCVARRCSWGVPFLHSPC